MEEEDNTQEISQREWLGPVGRVDVLGPCEAVQYSEVVQLVIETHSLPFQIQGKVSEPVQACCNFLHSFACVSQQNQAAMFEHLDFMLKCVEQHPGEGEGEGEGRGGEGEGRCNVIDRVALWQSCLDVPATAHWMLPRRPFVRMMSW